MLTQVPKQKGQEYNHTILLQKQLLSSKFNKSVSSLNTILIDTLSSQIQNKKLSVCQYEKPFKMKSNQIIGQKQKSNLSLSKVNLQKSDLIQKRQNIQNQLKKLEIEEYKLHINQSRYGMNLSKVSQGNSNNATERVMFRSELTEEEKVKIKEVLKNQKKFIKQLKKKEKKYYDLLEEDRKRNIEIQENMKKENCQQRKLYWQKIKQEVAARQNERKIKFIQDQQRLKQVKKSKKLYKILQNSWKNNQKINEKKIKQATQHMRKDHKFDLSKIKEHQKQYQKIAKQKSQSRQKNFEEFQQKVKSTLPKIPRSKFYQKIKQEERIKQQQQLERQKKKEQLLRRKSYFNTKVKQYFKPKIDQTLRHEILQQTKQQVKVQKKPGLPLGEIRNLGNEYMKQIHRSMALVKTTKQQDSKAQTVNKQRKPSYKNYLADLKQKRNAQEVKQSLTNQVTKIMKNTTYSTVQKIQRAKLVAKRLESKQNLKSTAIISSINQKLKILKVLNNEA